MLEERPTAQAGTVRAQPQAGEKVRETEPGNQQANPKAQVAGGVSRKALGELKSMSGETGIRLRGTAS